MPRPTQTRESDFKLLFGARVRELRKQKGLTQDKLAELADIGRDSIKNIEKGKHGPLFETLEKLVTALGCKPSELFEFSWPPIKRS